ncbi:putative pentatricopeptide repeat-containing protein At5g59200, chloroplastic [Wolffia australiana]
MAVAAPLLPGAAPSRHHRLPREEIGDLLQKCKGSNDFPAIHARIIKAGGYGDSILVFKLLRLCHDWNSPALASKIFNSIEFPDVYHYTAMISGRISTGSPLQAISLHSRMIAEGIPPDSFVISHALRACALAAASQEGKQIHGQILKRGPDLTSSRPVCHRLLEFYARSGDFSSARQVFDEMPNRDAVAATVLISCYAEFGMVADAVSVFEAVEDSERDTACWTAMIDGLARNDRANEALQFFRQMQQRRVRPNKLTLVCALSACSQLGAFELGKWIHSYVGKHAMQLNLFLGAALVDMYCRCGSPEDAEKVFAEMPDRDAIAYNSMIGGLAVNGRSAAAVDLFMGMQVRGLKPTPATFVSVLKACSHGGLVELGLQIFGSMETEHGIAPQIEHYGCVVDLLARAGRLQEACKFIKTMKVKPDNIMYCSILGGCKLYQDLDLGKRMVEKLLAENVESGSFVLAANFFAAFGLWEESAEIRARMRRRRRAGKEPGCSAIEVGGEVHEFLLGDIRHKRRREIYRKLEEMGEKVKRLGYSPETAAVLQDVGEGEKKRALEIHSERLAVCFGLISTEKGTTIWVVKNLRICGDCHDVMKLLAKVEGRKIIIRDRSRFHHFENGVCSCSDFW